MEHSRLKQLHHVETLIINTRCHLMCEVIAGQIEYTTHSSEMMHENQTCVGVKQHAME